MAQFVGPFDILRDRFEHQFVLQQHVNQTMADRGVRWTAWK
ncbi:hypothetical protein J2Z31_002990 [Sinorhizobium kostiense]|uniref:Transposase n=1 Tax=Sinorhizobium kostiense TaxID=76747 RepID=A0ABS4R0Q4_9HYPH|nr:MULTISPECIES: hypothetical protein [Sinorhizobium]MBP2236476.1 hypothetical protein [Sinorhizobium kostiense]